MRRKTAIFFILFLSAALSAFGQDKAADNSIFSLHMAPGVSLPIGRDRDGFSLGGGASLIARLKPPMLPFLFLEGGAGYSVAPLIIAEGEPVYSANLSLISPRVGAGVSFPIFSKFSAGGHAHGGYYFSFLNVDDPNAKGSNPLVDAGLDFSFRLIPSLALNLGVSYRNYLGLYNDFLITLGASYHFQQRAVVQGGMLPPGLKPYKELEILQLDILPVFPVFFKYYENNPLGSLVVKNTGKIPLEDVKVSLFVNKYMDNPYICRKIDFLKGSDEAEIDLNTLFNDAVLGITEHTKVQINITVESTVAGKNYGNETVETLRIYDRNAMAWDDDRKAAAFVTSKDPTVMMFSKNIGSLVKDKAVSSINPNFLKAIALHEALSLYGIRYEIDPTSSYEELSAKPLTIDYLQFPHQTLEYKAGDCDDLSILFCAMLESAAVETAFITIPGHIYMAFSLEISPEEAEKVFRKPDNLIMHENRAWVPVEITVIKEGFLQAWETGAKEWRENEPQNLVGFFPIRDAWKTYEATGFSGKVSPIAMPSEDEVLKAYMKEVEKFINIELYPRVRELQEKIEESGGNPGYINKLGVLYARYGQNDKAKAEFKKALAGKEYYPALINMGNMAFLDKNWNEALNYYQRAYQSKSSSSKIVLGLARIYHELEKYDEASRYYAKLKAMDERMAEKYSYLDLKTGDNTTRAASAESVKEAVEWDEE